MIKAYVRQFKLLLLLLIDLLFRIQKYVKYKWSGKHEVQRIFETETDIYEKTYEKFYEKTFQLDQWLARTKCTAICQFFEANFDRQYAGKETFMNQILEQILTNCRGRKPRKISSRTKNFPSHFRISRLNYYLSRADACLVEVISDLRCDLLMLIKTHKHLRLHYLCEKNMEHSILRIIYYRTSLLVIEELAAIKYDASVKMHTDHLVSLWNHLVEADTKGQESLHDEDDGPFPSEFAVKIDDKSNIISKRWSHIGFQGEDPGTDFRGMGLLGLIQLEYLSRKPGNLARDLLKRSLTGAHTYPFAIVGINLTFNLLNLFKDGSMKHLYYDTVDRLFRHGSRILDVSIFNEIYVELFVRFDCFWHASKPETIFEFKGLMEQFINTIRMDLNNRKFSLKFAY